MATALCVVVCSVQALTRVFIQPEHLSAGVQAEPKPRNNRRALQPATARSRRDHISPFINDIEVACITAGNAGRVGRVIVEPFSDFSGSTGDWARFISI